MTSREIARSMRLKAAELYRLANTLAEAADTLDPRDPPELDYDLLLRDVEDHEAPFGYKADGTPRKRPAPSEATRRKMKRTKSRKAREALQRAEQKPKEVRLRVLSGTAPTPAEMKDRKVAHSTAEG